MLWKLKRAAGVRDRKSKGEIDINVAAPWGGTGAPQASDALKEA